MISANEVMSAMEHELERQLSEAGKKLGCPQSKEELINILEQVENCLSKVEQSPSQTMLDAVCPSMSALVTPELLRHGDKDVKLVVATCISEITRITAPEAPYNDDLMREIFQLIVSTFEGLDEINSPSFGRRVTILETVAKVRSCVVMLDLECDDLILQMFQHFFATACENHPESVSASMRTIMSLVLDESEDISRPLLSLLLANLRRGSLDVSPAAHRLALNVVESCADKLKPYLQLAMSTERISESDLQKEYHDIIYDICCHPPHTMQPITSDTAELQVDGSHLPAPVVENTVLPQDQAPNLHEEDRLSPDQKESRITEDKHVPEDEKHLPEGDKEDDKGSLEKLRNNNAIGTGKDNASGDEVDRGMGKLHQGRRRGPSKRSTGMTRTQSDKLLDSKNLESDKPLDRVRNGKKSRKADDLSELVKADGDQIGSDAETLPLSKRKRGRLNKETVDLSSPGQSSKEAVGLASPAQSIKETVGLASPGRPSKEAVGSDSPAQSSKELVGLASPARSGKEATGVSSPGLKRSLSEEDNIGTASSRPKRGRPKGISKRSDVKEESNLEKLTTETTETVLDGFVESETTPAKSPVTDQQLETKKDSASKSSKKSRKRLDAGNDKTPKSTEIVPPETHTVPRESEPANINPDDDGKLIKKAVSLPESAEKNLAESGKSSRGTPRNSSKRKSISALQQTLEMSEARNANEEKLVGSKIKVWWPHDKQFYEGIVESYDVKLKKHKIFYNDGDIEVLNLRRERWELIVDETETVKSESALPSSPKSGGDTPAKKKTNAGERSLVREAKLSAKRKESMNQYDVKSDDNGALTSANIDTPGTETSGGNAESIKLSDKAEKPRSGSRGRRQKQGDDTKGGRRTGSIKQTNGTVKTSKGTDRVEMAADRDKKGFSPEPGSKSSDDEPLNAWRSRSRTGQ